MASPSSCLRLLDVGFIGQQIPCVQESNEEPSAGWLCGLGSVLSGSPVELRPTELPRKVSTQLL